MGLPGWYLTAGCLFQTVWNVVTDRSPISGIRDYDVFCIDCFAATTCRVGVRLEPDGRCRPSSRVPGSCTPSFQRYPRRSVAAMISELSACRACAAVCPVAAR
ncbi:nucleotidyltransferase family protein [Streptomyces decoyicus]|uniref:nucleotidyltransferase family protein n=1 Tax=Streptomyces decoyicus TaxID=249567 RepID=UPI003868E3C6